MGRGYHPTPECISCGEKLFAAHSPKTKYCRYCLIAHKNKMKAVYKKRKKERLACSHHKS